MKLRVLAIACILVLLTACEKESALDKYYNQDGNFSGSIYDALDSTGLYKIFINGVDSTAFDNQLKNTLITVVAPNDEAFKAYLAKKGYASLADMPQNELEDIIGHHIITWPHSPTSFVEEPIQYRRLTNMAQRTVTKFDIFQNKDITVIQPIKYLPFYFPEMLRDYGATEEDYTLLAGIGLSQATDFNIYDVPVDSIVPFGNGWIYYVNEVIEPVENLDDWLSGNEGSSLFNQLYNRYNYYTTPGTPLKRTNIFLNERNYRVDMELDYETVSDFNVTLKAASGFTVFAPTNEAMNGFMDTTFVNFPGFKESLNVVDELSIEGLHTQNVIRLMMYPYLFIDKAVFPSTIFSETGINGFEGTRIKFSESDINNYAICSNGYAYEVNKFLAPRSFTSILKPLTTTADYKYFLAAIIKVRLFSFLNDINADYTLMVPTDSAFIKDNLLLVTSISAINDYGIDQALINLNEVEEVFLQYDPSNSTYSYLSTQKLFDIVVSHLFTEKITPTVQQKFGLNAIGYYAGVTTSQVWSGGNVETKWTEPSVILPSLIKSISGTDNGNAYVVDRIIKSPTYSMGKMLLTDTTYKSFGQLCLDAGLMNTDGVLNIASDYPALFVPTNKEIDKYGTEGKIPSDEEGLRTFLKYFFVNKTVFTSESINENTETLCLDEELTSEFDIVYKTVEVNGTPGNLKIKGINNTDFLQVTEGNVSNIICTDGVIHQINGILN